MNDSCDVVIIGAGIAGLVAGNFLLDRGKRVLIIEKNPYPGGCACSFTREGYRFDAAVHWISQAGEGGVVRRILSGFGLGDRLGFDRLPRPATIITPSARLELDFGRERLVEAFSEAFSAERAGIDRLWAEADLTKEELWRLIRSGQGDKTGLDRLRFNITFPLTFPRIAKYHKRPAEEVIARHVEDNRLRRALGALGIFPGISFVHYSWFGSVALDGDAFYPKGGIQAVPDALAGRFIEKGGEIRYKTPAEGIIVDGGRAKGVRLAGGEEIGAKAVISAGDARNTLLNMVGEEHLPPGVTASVKKWRPSEAFFYVYLGLDMDLRQMGFDGSPIWYLPEAVDRANYPMLGGDALGIGMPSILDPSLAPPGKSIAILGMRASCAFMEGCPVKKSGGKTAYHEVKERVSGYLTDMAGGAIPGLKDAIAVKVAATPHTFERYTMNYMGASSGWSMAATAQHKLPIKAPVAGLYLAGHWTMNPGGVPAAFVSGEMAANEVK